jgi:hypothetical protein
MPEAHCFVGTDTSTIHAPIAPGMDVVEDAAIAA